MRNNRKLTLKQVRIKKIGKQMMSKQKKSPKDIAFDKERVKYRKEIRELEFEKRRFS